MARIDALDSCHNWNLLRGFYAEAARRLCRIPEYVL
jgi:hypothetical protein